MSERIRPGLSETFKEPLQGALKKVWWYLKNVAIGPTWRLYSHDDGLYLQKYDQENRQYESVSLWDSTGNFDSLVSVSPDGFCLHLHIFRLVGGAALGTIQTIVPIPADCTLEYVNCVARAVAGAPNPTADVYDENITTPASVIGGPITLAAANTVYSVDSDTITTSDFSQDDRLSLRCTTAALGSITELVFTLFFRTANTNTIYNRGHV